MQMKRLDPVRNDAGSRLRKLRLRRGMSLAVLAGLSGVTPGFLSMVENGQRHLRRSSHIRTLASVLGVSPFYLEDGIADGSGSQLPAPTPLPFPAPPDAATLGRHDRLAGEFAGFLARGDGRAAGDWLRRLAREPTVNPWLLIDQLAARNVNEMTSAGQQTPARARHAAQRARTGSKELPGTQ
jgi:transcriptional regulator with XRE-family HTH domain